MKSTQSQKPTLKGLGAVKRRQSVSLSQETLIEVGQLPPENPLPLVIKPINEMPSARNWSLKIAFHCVIKAQTGGETPIADSRRVFQRIDPKIRDRFQEKQILSVRNYGKGLDLPWQAVFQTTEKSEVETYCQNNGIELEWLENNCLKTRRVCRAIATHPKTSESVWFNQAHLFHISSLEPALREQMLSRFPESELPRHTYYGDGTTIEASILDEIREIYQQESVIFPWEEGDVLLLDNMLAAHGRRPFTGARKVVVGMAEPFAK